MEISSIHAKQSTTEKEQELNREAPKRETREVDTEKLKGITRQNKSKKEEIPEVENKNWNDDGANCGLTEAATKEDRKSVQ